MNSPNGAGALWWDGVRRDRAHAFMRIISSRGLTDRSPARVVRSVPLGATRDSLRLDPEWLIEAPKDAWMPHGSWRMLGACLHLSSRPCLPSPSGPT